MDVLDMRVYPVEDAARPALRIGHRRLQVIREDRPLSREAFQPAGDRDTKAVQDREVELLSGVGARREGLGVRFVDAGLGSSSIVCAPTCLETGDQGRGRVASV